MNCDPVKILYLVKEENEIKHLAPALAVSPFIIYSSCSRLRTMFNPMFAPGRDEVQAGLDLELEILELKEKQFP